MNQDNNEIIPFLSSNGIINGILNLPNDFGKYEILKKINDEDLYVCLLNFYYKSVIDISSVNNYVLENVYSLKYLPKIKYLSNIILQIENVQIQLLELLSDENILLKSNEYNLLLKQKILETKLYNLKLELNEFPVIPIISVLKIILKDYKIRVQRNHVNEILKSSIRDDIKLIDIMLRTDIIEMEKEIKDIENNNKISEKQILSIKNKIHKGDRNKDFILSKQLEFQIKLHRLSEIKIIYIEMCIDIIFKIIELRGYNVKYIKINENNNLYINYESLKSMIGKDNNGIKMIEIVTDTDICFLYLTDENYNTYNNNNLFNYSKIFCFGTLLNIGDDWMIDNKDGKEKKLTSISFSGLVKLKQIGSNFLRYNKIKTINFVGLNNVKEIGNNFCSDCMNVKECDLESLTFIEKIGDYCFSDCDNLEKVSLKNLNNLKEIGGYFSTNNSNLKEVKLDGINNVIEVGEHFLSNNINLKEVKLDGFKNIQIIGENFLSDNINLKELDFVNLNNIIKIGKSFLSNCKRISNVRNLKLSKTVDVKNNINFLENTPLKNIKNIK